MTDNPYRYPYVPVGGIIEWDGTGLTGAPDLSTPEKVAAVYGYGTWERYGTDRVTVGAGGEYEAGATGGEKAHTLTVAELPKILAILMLYHGHLITHRPTAVFQFHNNIKIKQCHLATRLVMHCIPYLVGVEATTICSPISPRTVTAASCERRTT